MIFSCPADRVSDYRQPRILLGLVEARSVNYVKNTQQPFDIFSPITGGCSEGLDVV